MSEENDFRDYKFTVSIDARDEIITAYFTETQEDTLQSFLDKLESGRFQTFSYGKGEFRLNTAKVVSYSYKANKRSL